MATNKKIGLRLDVEALTMLGELAPSENKKGEYLAGLIRAAYAQQTAPTPATATAIDPRRARLAALIAEAAPLAAQLLTGDDPPNTDNTAPTLAGASESRSSPPAQSDRDPSGAPGTLDPG